MRERFHQVPETYLHDRSRRRMSDAERVLADYLIMCRHANAIGVYLLPLPYAAHDLGWTVRKLRRTLAQLEARQAARYDEAAEYVFVPARMAMLDPENPNQAVHLQRSLAALPAGLAFARDVANSWNALAARVGQPLAPVALPGAIAGQGRETVQEPPPNGSETVSEPLPDRKKEQKIKQIDLPPRAPAREAPPPVASAPPRPRQGEILLPMRGGAAGPEEARQGAEAAGRPGADPGRAIRRQRWLANLGKYLIDHGAREERELWAHLSAKPEATLTRADRNTLNRWDARMRARGRAA